MKTRIYSLRLPLRCIEFIETSKQATFFVVKVCRSFFISGCRLLPIPFFFAFFMLCILVVCFSNQAHAQGIAINSDGSNPDASSMLDVKSTTSGLLIPRMTTTERDNIATACSCTPANGLMIFNTTTTCIEFYYNGIWFSLGCTCTVPVAPTATSATAIQQSSYSANWNSASGATTYYLDVSTNSSFSSFVSGFNNLNVGNVTMYNVSGLTCNTSYYYRVKANNSCGTSTNSNTISVTTSSCCPCIVSGFPLRRPVSITNTSGSGLTDFQVAINVTYDSDMKSDFADLRFRDGSCTDLSYWIESYTASTSAKVWVKVPSIPTSGTTIYMYYGNSGASGAGNGDNTFLAFDDFNDGSFNTTKWNYQTVSPTEESGVLKINYGTNQYEASWKTSLSTPIVMECYAKMISAGGANTVFGFYNGSAWGGNSNPNARFSDVGYSGFAADKVYLNVTTYSADFTYADDTYYKFRVDIADNCKVYIDGVTKITQAISTPATSEPALNDGSATPDITWIDYFFARKYSTVEPGTSVGAVESCQ